jgi:prevent-host-death family protein
MKPIPAARAKAQFLALLDTVERTGEDVVITRRGRPVARLARLEAAQRDPVRWRARLTGDVVAPLEEAWSAR